MKGWVFIWSLVLSSMFPLAVNSQGEAQLIRFELFGDTVEFPVDHTVITDFSAPPAEESIQAFYDKMNAGNYQPVINALLAFRQKHQLDDWFFYQLIRRSAQQIAPKAENYHRYTLYKWFFLSKSGYDARLATCATGKIIFYVRCEENIYDIPFYVQDGKQYVCLNIHDYDYMSETEYQAMPVNIEIPEGQRSFSYRITNVPAFTPDYYAEKNLQFSYGDKAYHFTVKLNPEMQTFFRNYPVVDYASYFNIPLSRETYSSLIPMLKKQLQGMKQKQGVDFLMRFTREAFLYQADQQSFGREKRLPPEQTLLNEYSDCDDRAALFFYLVKEIYDLPMLVLAYPTHVTVAVKFDKPIGAPILYNGNKYSVCEPTPQPYDLRIGQLSPALHAASYEVAYAYEPLGK